MVWIYETPPSSKKDREFFRHLKRALKSEAHAQRTAKLISLYLFLREHNFKTVKEIQGSAFYDKKLKKPIFDEKSARKILLAMKQRGGRSESTYPFADVFVKGLLRDYTPDAIGNPVKTIYGDITGFVDGIKTHVPFVDLFLALVHSGTEFGVTTAGDVAEGVGGPVGAAAVLPFTAIAAGITSAISVLDADLGQAVAHLANVIPLIGSALGKAMTKNEELAKKLVDHPTLASYIPYMTEYHEKLKGHIDVQEEVPKGQEEVPKGQEEVPKGQEEVPKGQEAGKRLSTRKRRHPKWRRTMRQIK